MLILGEAISQIWIDGLENIVADSGYRVKNFNFCEDREITGYLERLLDQFLLEKNVYTWAEVQGTIH